MKKDINKNASGGSKFSAISEKGQAKEMYPITPASPMNPIGGTGGNMARAMYPIRNASGVGEKFIAKTDAMGITEEGKLSKSFGLGVIAAIAGIVIFKQLQKKGYLKFMNK